MRVHADLDPKDCPAVYLDLCVSFRLIVRKALTTLVVHLVLYSNADLDPGGKKLPESSTKKNEVNLEIYDLLFTGFLYSF